MKKSKKYLKRHQNKTAFYLVLGFMTILSAVLIIECHSLNKEINSLQAAEVQYQQDLYAEQQRTLELQEFEKTTHTKKYYEQVARERLGMVHKDEIIFKDK